MNIRHVFSTPDIDTATAAMDAASANNDASPAIRTRRVLSVAVATPRTMPRTLTSPSCQPRIMSRRIGLFSQRFPCFIWDMSDRICQTGPEGLG